jgi:hypothetical protein
MLAPDINTTKNQLTTIFNEVTSITGFSIGVQDTQIGTLPLEPSWLPSVRSEMKLLSEKGASWMINYPDSFASILTPFMDYATDFSAVNDKIKKNKQDLSTNQVIELLTILSTSLKDCSVKTKDGLDSLTDFENQFTTVFPLLSSSIQSGWEELKEEEAEMIAIAEAITKLQDEISSLQSKIDADSISGGKTFVQTTVKISYDIISAAGEVAIPYLSIVTLAYTIGKTFYDIISDTDEINKDLLIIGDLQLKATIQYLYNIEIQFLSLTKHGSGLLTMWKDEKTKIDEAINAINAGADPSSFLDILTMDVANKNWDVLMNFSQKILNMPRELGRDVTFKTQNN